MLLGGRLQDKPPGLGTRPQGLATYGLTAHAYPLGWNFSGSRTLPLDLEPQEGLQC